MASLRIASRTEGKWRLEVVDASAALIAVLRRAGAAVGRSVRFIALNMPDEGDGRTGFCLDNL